MISRLVCLIRGHNPMFYDARSAVQGVQVITACVRCRRFVSQTARIDHKTRLKVLR